MNLSELSESRFLKLIDSVIQLMLLGHGFLVALFWFLGHYEMMLVNLCFSVPTLAFSYLLIKKNLFPNLRTILPYFELIVHSFFAIHFLGWDTGFYFYLVAALVAAQFYPWKLVVKISVSILLSALTVASYIYYSSSYSALESVYIDGFFIMNLISTVLYLSFFILFQIRLSEELEDKLFSSNAHLEENNVLISQQKHQLEERHQEIQDSIKYAQRIQHALLPSQKLLKQNLKDSFVLYKPKDIVAGDFYWLEDLGEKVLFAAADCTGHGVPGAMVSVICNGALNRSVREFGLTDPGQILDKTRDIVVEEFEKSDDEVTDGMDIALCSLEGNILKYSGANNPLWIIRNGEILVTKADKQPIGKFDYSKPFRTHSIELLKGDSVYIFSDGFVDQFGGEKGKKYKSKAFKDLLLSVQVETMENQKEIIDTAFENWRGELEQIDDVCLIGVHI